MRTAVSWPRRSGLSLTEVLIAIFLMAIGMLSLLALFPLGLSNMRWAMQDSRLALASANAISMAEMSRVDPVTGRPFNMRSDPLYYEAIKLMTDQSGTSPLYDIVTMPSRPNPWFDPYNGAWPSVFVDPIGVFSAFPADGVNFRIGFNVGTDNASVTPSNKYLPFSPPLPAGSNGLQRVRPSFISSRDQALRTFAQEDEITFDPNGQPTNNTGTIERETRYSWAYMCRWPRGADTSICDLSIVLFNGRQLRATGTERTFGEKRYFGHPIAGYQVFSAGSPEVIIDVMEYKGGGSMPPTTAAPSSFKRGDWILDNTMIRPTVSTVTDINGLTIAAYGPILNNWNPVASIDPRPLLDKFPPEFFPAGWTVNPALPYKGLTTSGPVRGGLTGGNFYRIVSVGDLEFANGRYFQRIILDRPARSDGFEAVHMPNVIDVIEKSDGRSPQH